MEYLDVVNDKDEVVGKELKILCHKNDLMHRGSGILVFKDNHLDAILLQKRSRSVRQDPGLWCNPGGHVQSGESYETAAKRECQEELFSKNSLPLDFFQTSHLKHIFTFFKNQPFDREFIAVFQMIYQGPFSPLEDEVEQLQFFHMSEIGKNLLTHPEIYTFTFQKIFNLYQKNTKKG